MASASSPAGPELADDTGFASRNHRRRGGGVGRCPRSGGHGSVRRCSLPPFRGVVAQENGPGVPDRAGYPLGSLGDHLHVFGSPPIDDFDGIAHDLASTIKPFRSSATRAMAPLGVRASASSNAPGRFGQIGIGGDAPAGGRPHRLAWAMRSAATVGPAVRSAMTSSSVGPSTIRCRPVPRPAAWLRPPSASRPDDLVHPGNRPGAVGQCRDGLAPPIRNPSDSDSAQAPGPHRSPLGPDYRKISWPRDQGGHRVHHDRGRVRCLPPARRGQRDPALPLASRDTAVRLGQWNPVSRWRSVIVGDPANRPSKRLP